MIGLLVSTLGRVEDSQAHDFAVVAPPGTPPRRILDMTASMLPIIDNLPPALGHHTG